MHNSAALQQYTTMGSLRAGALIHCGAIATAAAILLTGICGSRSAAGQARSGDSAPQAGWKQVRDAQHHIALSTPVGWTVRVDEHRIVITSADHAAFAWIENFVPQNDETAEDHVDNLPKSDADVLSRCKVVEAYTLDAAVKTQAANGAEGQTGEQAIGTLTYTGERGPGQGRVLCLVFPKGGLIFGLAASNDRFTAERPSMLRTLQSFQFYGPTGAGQAGGKSSADASATGLDALSNIPYVNWPDPRDHAFSLDGPKGWTLDGGNFRASPLENRQMVLARSPHDEMAIMLGDAGLPGLFTLPSQNLQMQGHPEGSVWQLPNNMSSLVIHYMPAAEFNHWYLTNFLGKSVDDLEIGEDTDRPAASEKLTESANKMLPAGSQAHYSVTVAETSFTCVSKVNGRRMAGILNSSSSCFLGNARGEGNWSAHPTIIAWATGDSRTEARKAAVKEVALHMTKTWKENAAWSAAEMQKQKQFMAANAQPKPGSAPVNRSAVAAQSRVMTRNTVQASDDRRAKMMGDFRARMAAKDDQTRKMVNYSLDQTDVTNGSQSWKVASGYSNYYRHEATGTIVGTNNPNHPGVGFTQLGQR
jgi:hypothetical protein